MCSCCVFHFCCSTVRSTANGNLESYSIRGGFPCSGPVAGLLALVTSLSFLQKHPFNIISLFFFKSLLEDYRSFSAPCCAWFLGSSSFYCINSHFVCNLLVSSLTCDYLYGCIPNFARCTLGSAVQGCPLAGSATVTLISLALVVLGLF